MYFIVCYTHKCKEYCDRRFFEALGGLPSGKYSLLVIDNSPRREDYHDRLRHLVESHRLPGTVEWLEIPLQEDFMHTFLNNVATSVNFARERFLVSGSDRFLIIESDVIVPPNLLELFDDAVAKLPDYGIIGGLYYDRHHDPALHDPHNVEMDTETNNVFSGVTLYSRRLLERIPFRWTRENIAEFPDTWMKLDARAAGFRTANYNAIKALHLRGGW